MSATIKINIDLSKIDKSLINKTEKGSYYNMSIFVNDELKFGNNVSVKEDYPSKADWQRAKDRGTLKNNYLGNGRVVETDGIIVTASSLALKENGHDDKSSQTTQDSVKDESDDLPF